MIDRRGVVRALAAGSVLHGLLGCSAVLDLRDDYQLADGGGAHDASRDGGAKDARTEDQKSGDAAHDSGLDVLATPDVKTGTDAGPHSDAGPSDAMPVDAESTDALVDAPVLVDAATISPPELIAPTTTSTTSIQTPTLHWSLPAGVTGAWVEICNDRPCTMILTSFAASGSAGKVPTMLAPGVHFWRAYGMVGTEKGTVPSPTWELWARLNSGVAGEADTSFGGFPDFDGDGLGDVMASGGGLGLSNPGTDIFLGAKTTGPTEGNTFKLSPPGGVNGLPSDFGDIDGDGYSDLVSGLYAVGDAGAGDNVTVFRGAMGFGAATAVSWTIPVPNALNDAGAGTAQFAASLSVPGDVNGDGYEDILVSSTRGVFLYFGHKTGPSLTPDVILVGPNPGTTLTPAGRVGDLDGDGYNDAVLVDQNRQTAYFYPGGANGPSDGTSSVIGAPPSPGRFGTVTRGSGDINGDGYADLIVADRYATPDAGTYAGAAYVYYGHQVGDLTISATLSGNDPQGLFGYFSAIVGDVNADGFDDFTAGAPESIGGDHDGRAFFYAGGASGLTFSNELVSQTGQNGNWFGGCAIAGDVNGDGVLDALIAYSVGGSINVYLGAAGKPISAMSPQLTLYSLPFIYYLAKVAEPPRGNRRHG